MYFDFLFGLIVDYNRHGGKRKKGDDKAIIVGMPHEKLVRKKSRTAALARNCAWHFAREKIINSGIFSTSFARYVDQDFLPATSMQQ